MLLKEFKEKLKFNIDQSVEAINLKVKPIQEKIEEKTEPLTKKFSNIQLDLEIPKKIISSFKISNTETSNTFAEEFWKENINPFAGMELISSFEKNILQLHENNEKLKIKAEVI